MIAGCHDRRPGTAGGPPCCQCTFLVSSVAKGKSLSDRMTTAKLPGRWFDSQCSHILRRTIHVFPLHHVFSFRYFDPMVGAGVEHCQLEHDPVRPEWLGEVLDEEDKSEQSVTIQGLTLSLPMTTGGCCHCTFLVSSVAKGKSLSDSNGWPRCSSRRFHVQTSLRTGPQQEHRDHQVATQAVGGNLPHAQIPSIARLLRGRERL